MSNLTKMLIAIAIAFGIWQAYRIISLWQSQSPKDAALAELRAIGESREMAKDRAILAELAERGAPQPEPEAFTDERYTAAIMADLRARVEAHEEAREKARAAAILDDLRACGKLGPVGEPLTREKADEISMMKFATLLVTQRFSDPETARFPSFCEYEILRNLSNDTVRIFGYFDTLNDFKVRIRSNFLVTFKRVPGRDREKNWRVKSIAITPDYYEEREVPE